MAEISDIRFVRCIFDSIYDRDYYDTVDGLLKKGKIRLRIYGQESPIKLEYKQKEGSDSQKQSLILSREEAERMMRCDYGFLSRRPEPVAYVLYMKLMQGAYQPKTLVEYDPRSLYLSRQEMCA